jgi:hypothetical protein
MARTRAASTVVVEHVAVTTRRLVAAVEGRATASATAPGDIGVRLNDEVRPVVDQLRVDPHDLLEAICASSRKARCNCAIA